MLLDARSALAADDTLVHWMIAVTIDVDNLSIFQMHFDAAAAGAHVTGGGFDLVPILR